MKAKAMIRLGLLFSLVAVVMVMWAGSAAAEDELSMRWDIQADFTGEAPDVNLIVEVGVYDEEGNWQQLAETINPLACEAENVQWTEPEAPAIFNGDAYVVCEMQDATKIANDMTGFDFPQFVDAAGTWVEAELMPNGNDNPVFYHPDIQFEAGARMSLAVGMDGNGSQRLTAVSDIISLNQQQLLRGEFGESADFRLYYPAFSINGKPIDAASNVLDGKAIIDQTVTGAIYFGYSPETDSYFEGHVYTIDVDPGCSGMG